MGVFASVSRFIIRNRTMAVPTARNPSALTWQIPPKLEKLESKHADKLAPEAPGGD